MTRSVRDYTCVVCTAEFAATQPAKYCTAACQQKAMRARHPKPRPRNCELCSSVFDARQRPFAHYCCDEHQRQAANAGLRRRRLAANPYRVVTCRQCGGEYRTNTLKKKFCTEDCRATHHYLNGDGARRQRIEYWFAADPEGARLARQEWSQRRRAEKAGSKDSVGVSRRDWERLIRRYHGCCAYCGKRAPLQRDHIIPIARGGRHAIGNVLPSCARCNATKKAKFLSVWKHRGAPYAKPPKFSDGRLPGDVMPADLAGWAEDHT